MRPEQGNGGCLREATTYSGGGYLRGESVFFVATHPLQIPVAQIEGVCNAIYLRQAAKEVVRQVDDVVGT